MTKSASDARRRWPWRKRQRAEFRAGEELTDAEANTANETIVDLKVVDTGNETKTVEVATNSTQVNERENAQLVSTDATAVNITISTGTDEECLIVDVDEQKSLDLAELNNTGVHCIQLVSLNRTSADKEEALDATECNAIVNATAPVNASAVEDGSVAMKPEKIKRSLPFFRTRRSKPGKKVVKNQRKGAGLLRRTTNYLLLFLAVIAAAPYIPSDIEDLSLPFVSEGDTYKRIHRSLEEPPVLARGTNEDETTVSIGADEDAETDKSDQDAQEIEVDSNKPPLLERRAMALSYVTEAVHKVGPSVLRIDTESNFQDFQEDKVPTPHPPGWIQQGQGSGLIFSSDGLILTNAHVVEDASKVTVTLTDGRVFDAEVKGTDEIVDVAVLKILPNGNKHEAMENLPVAELGDSDKLNVGQIVIAVGTPGGLDNTVTMGIVSGLERSSTIVGIPHKKVDYIQTDAAINPGNSGGPLVDVESGRVVGINACIRANMEGTSFAIPINRVRELLDDLANGKQIHHGYLGVSMATCTPEWAKQTNEKITDGTPRIPEVHGALVGKVFPRTPAMDGGLMENDIVTQIGGKRVRTSDDARRLIDRAPVGEDLTISVLRNNRPVILTVRPVDLATRLREMRLERQRQIMQDRLRFQELGPFRALLQ